MDEKTLEEELAKSFENVRADESNVMDCYGVRAVLKNSVLDEFESRHPEILVEDDDIYYFNLSKLSKAIDKMYGPIGSEELCLAQVGSVIVFPEDHSRLKDLKISPWFLINRLANAMDDLECAIDETDEESNEFLSDIRSRFEESQRLVKELLDIFSRNED